MMSPLRRAGGVLRVALVDLAVLAGLVVVLELVFGSRIGGPGAGLLRATNYVTYRFDTSSLHEGGGVVLYRRDLDGPRGTYEDVGKIDILTPGRRRDRPTPFG